MAFTPSTRGKPLIATQSKKEPKKERPIGVSTASLKKVAKGSTSKLDDLIAATIGSEAVPAKAEGSGMRSRKSSKGGSMVPDKKIRAPKRTLDDLYARYTPDYRPPKPAGIARARKVRK